MRRARIALATATALALCLIAPAEPAMAASPISLTSGFFADPDSVPATWVRNNPNDSRAARIQASIGSKPIAKWFGNVASIGTAVGRLRRAGRQRGQGAGPGGLQPARSGRLRRALGRRRRQPGGLPHLDRRVRLRDRYPAGDRDHRARLAGRLRLHGRGRHRHPQRLLTFATQQFRDRAPNTYAYLDAGNFGWVAASTMAGRLHAAGVANLRGFAINVSNFYTTSQSVSYGNSVNSGLSSRGYTRPFVVDTSRNANGHNGQWCNPPGRRLGLTARVGGGPELQLWIKTPGSSDGPCGIAPNTPAGTFNPDLAIRLIDGT